MCFCLRMVSLSDRQPRFMRSCTDSWRDDVLWLWMCQSCYSSALSHNHASCPVCSELLEGVWYLNFSFFFSPNHRMYCALVNPRDIFFFSPLNFNLSLVAKVENRGIGSKRMCTHGDPIHGHADGFGLFKLFIGGGNMPPQDIRCLGEKIWI